MDVYVVLGFMGEPLGVRFDPVTLEIAVRAYARAMVMSDKERMHQVDTMHVRIVSQSNRSIQFGVFLNMEDTPYTVVDVVIFSTRSPLELH